jgi:hypothetical protein
MGLSFPGLRNSHFPKILVHIDVAHPARRSPAGLSGGDAASRVARHPPVKTPYFPAATKIYWLSTITRPQAHVALDLRV